MPAYVSSLEKVKAITITLPEKEVSEIDLLASAKSGGNRSNMVLRIFREWKAQQEKLEAKAA